MNKNLVIVESPAKAKTIEKFLGKDFSVKSSFGHIRDLKEKDFSINVEDNYSPIYTVPSDKKKLVTELKKEAKEATTVWLASDEDREGEAIAWHLSEELQLPKEKTKRIVFHEITKDAILNAIENPRDINLHLVDAQQARRVLDRIVGFKASPILWKKIKPSLSAGRVQSVAVRLIVEREREIQNFKAETSFKVSAIFEKAEDQTNNVKIKAELQNKFKTKKEAFDFLELCKTADFKVDNIVTKPTKKSPAPPFTTSTLQQEASRKLGYSVSQTMRIAQQLYEAGKITYMRTDSVNLSNLAYNTAKKQIVENLGEEYLQIRKYKSKSLGAQEAHEAIRPTYIENQTIDGSAQEKRLYELIWKRTIASQMSDAKFEKTTATISLSNSDKHFIATGEVLIFDGFLHVYMESNDEENENTETIILPPLKSGDKLVRNLISAQERFSQKPPRYTEASLVQKMEELGIGRPSTYAPTISTIQKRAYVERKDIVNEEKNYTLLSLSKNDIKEEIKSTKNSIEKKKLIPTDIGCLVNDFLMINFSKIMDYHFTANIEKEFDEIAAGKIIWTKSIDTFYKDFIEDVEKAAQKTDKKVGERELGIDPKSGKPVYVKIGRYGAVAQIGSASDQEKPTFAALQNGQSIETITLEEALNLFKLPMNIGIFENENVSVAVGRFGPYIKYGNTFVSIPKDENPLEITLKRATELILEKRSSDKNREIKKFENEGILILNGRYGPYISYKKKNFKIPKNVEPKDLTLEMCKEIIEKEKTKVSSRKK